VTQPFDSNFELPSLREIDKERGEFWVGNPFQFSSAGENLSSYEHNGVHLNDGDGEFIDMSFLTGADSPGDGRSVVSCDITGDGMPELLVRQVGGSSLIVYENRFPKANWLRVSLRGTKSNRQGIGSKVVCEVEGRTIRRELYPATNFQSQSPALVELGLGDAKKIKTLKISWPSGIEQELDDLPINSHIEIEESGAFRIINH